MSLLDNGPHVVYVQNRDWTKDSGGRRVFHNVGDPVPHRCMAQPARDWSSAEENVKNGLQVTDLLVILSREWSGNVHSHITYNGSVYEMVGAPQHFGASRRTKHWRATVKWIGTVE